MKNWLFAMCIVALSWSHILLAQDSSCDITLSGTTLEEHHPEPLSYAVIQVLELDTMIVSDDEGHYILQDLCEGQYTLVCSFLGFQTDTQRVYLEGDRGVFFTLHPADCELDEVVVSAGYTEIRIPDTEQPVADAGIQLLEEISGADLLQTGNNTFKPVNHGLHSSRLRVIQAGTPVENQQWGEEHGLELAGVRSFTLQDQNSLLFHHDGIGGVLLAEPSMEVNEDTVYNLQTLIYGSGNSNGRSGKVGGELATNLGVVAPWLGVKVFGSGSKGGDFSTPEYSLNNTGFANYDYGFMLDAKHKVFTSTLFYSLQHQELGIFSGSHIGNLTDFQNALEAPRPFDSHINSFDYETEGPKQEVLHELVSYKLKVYDKVEVQLSRQFNQRQEFEGHAGEEPEIDLQLNLTTWNGDLRYRLEKEHTKAVIGVGAMNQQNTWEYRPFIPNYAFNRMGGYGLINHSFNANNRLVAGARYDMYRNRFYLSEGLVDRQYGFLSYSLEYYNELNEKYRFSARNGMSWRPPAANELFSSGVHHGAAVIEEGDPNLNKEVSNQLLVEIERLYGKVFGSANVYGNYIQNYIYSQPSGELALTVKGAFPVYQYVQTDALFYGSDFNFNYELLHKTSNGIRVNGVTKYTYVKTYDFSTSAPLIGINPSRLEQKLEVRSRHFNRYSANDNEIRHSWKWTIAGRYVFERNNTNRSLEFAAPPEGYMIFNTTFTYQVKSRLNQTPINVRLGVYNLLNTTYRSYMNRYRFFADEMGRNVKLSIEIPLNFTNQ